MSELHYLLLNNEYPGICDNIERVHFQFVGFFGCCFDFRFVFFLFFGNLIH